MMLLDSLWSTDSIKYVRTIAAIITDPLLYSMQAGSGAANEFTRRKGPIDWMLRALNGPALTDGRRLLILDALYGPLTDSEQAFLLEHACGIALGLATMTPRLAELHRISGWEHPPAWYQDDLLALEMVQELLEGDARSRFDRIIEPVIEEAESAIARWITS
jgi:hypothetical protein